MTDLTKSEMDKLLKIADVMLPGEDKMPQLSAVSEIRDAINKVLSFRPDLVIGLKVAIESVNVENFELVVLPSLLLTDSEAYQALTTVIAASYYHTEEVKDLIGYPGQVPKTYDPFAYVEWVQAGLLDPVVSRGAIWRDPRKEIHD